MVKIAICWGINIPICLVRLVIIDHIYGTGDDIFTIHEIYPHHDIPSGISIFFFAPRDSPNPWEVGLEPSDVGLLDRCVASARE